jgi:hypothetical protein
VAVAAEKGRAKPKPKPQAAERTLGGEGGRTRDSNDEYLIGQLRHLTGCPADGQRPGEVYHDQGDDGATYTFASRVELIRAVTNPHMNPSTTAKVPGLDEEHGTQYAVIRCAECGAQFPSGN